PPSLTHTCLFLIQRAPSPRLTLFPYTTLFRSISFFMSVSFQNRGVSLHTNRVLAGLFDGRLRDATEFRAASYRTPTRDEIVGKRDRKSTRLNSSHVKNSYAVF